MAFSYQVKGILCLSCAISVFIQGRVTGIGDGDGRFAGEMVGFCGMFGRVV